MLQTVEKDSVLTVSVAVCCLSVARHGRIGWAPAARELTRHSLQVATHRAPRRRRVACDDGFENATMVNQGGSAQFVGVEVVFHARPQPSALLP